MQSQLIDWISHWIHYWSKWWSHLNGSFRAHRMMNLCDAPWNRNYSITHFLKKHQFASIFAPKINIAIAQSIKYICKIDSVNSVGDDECTRYALFVLVHNLKQQQSGWKKQCNRMNAVNEKQFKLHSEWIDEHLNIAAT